MKKTAILAALLLVAVQALPYDNIMDTEINAFRKGARIAGSLEPVAESVRFGDSKDSVVHKLDTWGKEETVLDDGHWTISFWKGRGRRAYLNWTDLDGKPQMVNATLVGSDEFGLVELDYSLVIGDLDEPRERLYERALSLYAWVMSVIGEPIENPANLVKPDTISAVWITDDNIIVHLESEGKPFAHLKLVSPEGPSRAEVEAWGKAHAAQVAMDEFMKARVGMSLDEVVQEFGSEGELQTEELVDGVVLQTYVWKNGDGSSASIVVNPDGVVVKKTQEGLK